MLLIELVLGYMVSATITYEYECCFAEYEYQRPHIHIIVVSSLL